MEERLAAFRKLVKCRSCLALDPWVLTFFPVFVVALSRHATDAVRYFGSQGTTGGIILPQPQGETALLLTPRCILPSPLIVVGWRRFGKYAREKNPFSDLPSRRAMSRRSWIPPAVEFMALWPQKTMIRLQRSVCRMGGSLFLSSVRLSRFW